MLVARHDDDDDDINFLFVFVYKCITCSMCVHHFFFVLRKSVLIKAFGLLSFEFHETKSIRSVLVDVWFN